VFQRVSPIEWSGSTPVMASGSASAVVASSKETLCFLRFAVALRSSHVTRIDRFYDLIGHCSASSGLFGAPRHALSCCRLAAMAHSELTDERRWPGGIEHPARVS
jgi:hypothetical protein